MMLVDNTLDITIGTDFSGPDKPKFEGRKRVKPTKKKV